MLLSGTSARAASHLQDVDEFNQAITLKEAGYSFPAIEESLKFRREAIARVEAEKAAKGQTALARAKDDKASVKN